MGAAITLREQFRREMTDRGLSDSTQNSYQSAVELLVMRTGARPVGTPGPKGSTRLLFLVGEIPWCSAGNGASASVRCEAVLRDGSRTSTCPATTSATSSVTCRSSPIPLRSRLLRAAVFAWALPDQLLELPTEVENVIVAE